MGRLLGTPQHYMGIHLYTRQANVMCARIFEVINNHTVGSLTIPRASIKWVQLWELLAYILKMHSYSNAYINRAGLARLL